MGLLARSGLPLTLALSPQAGRGDWEVATSLLRPACGEKVAGRPDEGQTRTSHPQCLASYWL
ncbi:hypothetical protein ILFOPFJJ_01096 [Ensifer psoraleae]|nr:hypothetical protein [Sinorhizobium psoraleae]